MSRLTSFLRRCYAAMPIVGELRSIANSAALMREDLRRIAAKELAELQLSILDHPRYGDPARLIRYSHQLFSQNGEDGIVAELARRVGTSNRTFLEIGTGNGLENNTAALLMQGWSGWWIEGSEENVAKIRRTFRRYVAAGSLTVERSLVSTENVRATLERVHVPREFDLLSLDIDRNTYWVWAALEAYKPRIVVIEYNAMLPPDVDWKVEYRAERVWNRTSYFGASLKALELLGRKLGYALVGCDFTGVNAFFVRDDLLLDKFSAPFTAENHYEPPRYGLTGIRLGHYPGVSDD
jgi:hypothetical protein